MKRSGLIGLLTMALALLLSGCIFSSADELYALPALSEEYSNLQLIREELLRTGLEYAPPLSGTNTQAVQLRDLNHDGVDEALFFLRDINGGERPLKIYIFRQRSAGLYEVSTIIEGAGTSISSIVYCDLTGTGTDDIAVSWQLSSNVYTLSAYSLYGLEAMELMSSPYTGYSVCDIDQDNLSEIILLRLGAAETGSNQAQLFDYENGAMELHSTALLSNGISAISRKQYGFLQGAVPALYVAGYMSESTQVTDILAMRDNVLTNITLDPQTGISSETIRYYITYGTDINNDSILELPMPSVLPSYAGTSAADSYWLIDWRQYDLAGNAQSVMTTYHNRADGWYFQIPDSWIGRLTISRRNSVSGERAVVFSRWINETTPPQDFLVIYRLTGDNRVARSTMGNRQVLVTESDEIYAFELITDSWNCGLDKDGVLERFNFIRTEWQSE